MGRYMTMVKYAADAYSGTAKDGPSTRAQVLREYAQSQGSEIEGMWYSAGEWDLVLLTNGEFDARALATQWAAMGSGAFSSMVSFPVFEPDEFQAGFDEMGTSTYRPPGAD